MTKAAQIDKLYSKLRPEELAGLAFEANVRGDDDEYAEILSGVGKRTYVCLNQEFSLRLNNYNSLGMFYGATYWKNLAYMEFVGNLQKEKQSDRHDQLHSHFLDNLLAMDVALQAVCEKAKIDVMVVKKLAGCDDEYIPNKCNNEGLVNGYVGLLMRFVE